MYIYDTTHIYICIHSSAKLQFIWFFFQMKISWNHMIIIWKLCLMNQMASDYQTRIRRDQIQIRRIWLSEENQMRLIMTSDNHMITEIYLIRIWFSDDLDFRIRLILIWLSDDLFVWFSSNYAKLQYDLVLLITSDSRLIIIWLSSSDYIWFWFDYHMI